MISIIALIREDWSQLLTHRQSAGLIAGVPCILATVIMGDHGGCILTHWGWDNMATILQMTFVIAFSWMKKYEFWLWFHWSFFLRFQLKNVSIGSDKVMGWRRSSDKPLSEPMLPYMRQWSQWVKSPSHALTPPNPRMTAWHGTFSALLALCDENPLVTSGFPSQRASDVTFRWFLWC